MKSTEEQIRLVSIITGNGKKDLHQNSFYCCYVLREVYQLNEQDAIDVYLDAKKEIDEMPS